VTSERWYETDDPRRLDVKEASVMRALAHPARIAILEHLFAGQSGTATELAEVCGLSPSATSYHLRALAKVNLIQEAPNRGDGRERVWRSAFSGFNVSSGPSASVAEQTAEHELTSMYMDIENSRTQEWLARRNDETQEWYDAAGFIGTRLVVTAEELNDLNKKINDLMEPYALTKREQVPDGARPVQMVYRTFPIDY
jgi:DNA-binding transcriptional ArsR family regulator